VRVAIRLDADTDELRLEVRDNGPGFDPENVPEGSGLQNMRDRLGAVGGRAKIVSTPGRGTCVRGVVPAYPRETAAERF
jgi:signal transduction histidine kinase